LRARLALAVAAIAVIAPHAMAAAPPEGRHGNVVVIVNDTPFMILHFYAHEEGMSDWTEDWLGELVIEPGKSLKMDFDAGPNRCRYHIRIDVKLASASLGDATQDEMLQGGDFLGSAASPTASWRATSIRRIGPNRYSASGTLSLKGASMGRLVTSPRPRSTRTTSRRRSLMKPSSASCTRVRRSIELQALQSSQ